MRKFSFVLFALLLSVNMLFAQKNQEIYSIGFYNLENLFDTIHDKGKNDYEYLPDGVNRWNTKKYRSKLKNMATVLNEMSADETSMGLAAVGVSEVENIRVLKDLVNHKILAHRKWGIVHVEGPDKRGADCALLYNPQLFTPLDSRLVPYTTADNDASYKTRGFLTVAGELAGEKVYIIVNHWPSRYTKSFARERAGVLVKAIKDSIVAVAPDAKIVIMGDLNDDPDDESVKNSLGAKQNIVEVKSAGDLYNPWWNILRRDRLGTLKYKGKWNLFDQIIVGGNLVGKRGVTLKFHKAQIFVRDYMLHKSGKHKGSPKRTLSGREWLDGYSDHLPVIIYLKKD
ncbi:MAG: endonuclease/exonuclease/phosphatase family protein [Bacteroidaceae bacterium]|nr:endonuclease/exonuclease/phosphatase family protein [Bacteroidaceae bacterium]